MGGPTFAPFLRQISTKVWHMIHQWTRRDWGFLVIWNLFPNIFSIKSAFFSRPFSRKTKRVLKKRIILPYYALSQLSNEGLLVLGGQQLWQFCVGPSHVHRINERTLGNIGGNMGTFVFTNNLKNSQIAASRLLLLLHSGRAYSQILFC